ncbi:MAG: hypothetical protein HZT40_02465 [Candidatus Thiothrix singaporensis]|uniref:Uncharacterized protein n=1 Tax=Candidatus Thiothrix singaporensis TaxID=2799669 RepID=A0A7L6ANI8_9GAMM|nr:MAG: hypothetical protein HZT40_02465 [Candidatus Thiothrix singaporensis]
MAAAGGKQRGRLQLPGQRPAGQHRHQPDGERPADGRQHRICAAALPDRGRLVLPDYTYKAYSAGGGSTLGMVSPANNSTLAGSSATFSWSAGGTSVTAWWLYVGSTSGGTQYLDTGNLGASVTSRTVSGLPTDGSTVYVQLWYLSGSWKSLSYTYKAASPAAAGDDQSGSGLHPVGEQRHVQLGRQRAM